jgi:hypothetical protein
MARGSSRANSEIPARPVIGFRNTQDIFDVRERSTRRLPNQATEINVSPTEALQKAAINFSVDLNEAQKFVAGPGGKTVNMMVPSEVWKKDVVGVVNRARDGSVSMHGALEGVRRNYLAVAGYTGDKKVPKDVIKASLVYMDMVARGASRAFD